MEDLVAYQERDEILLLKVGCLKSWMFEINNNMFSNLHLVFNPKETNKKPFQIQVSTMTLAHCRLPSTALMAADLRGDP